MPSKAYFRICDIQHDRPVGRKCNRRQVGDAAATVVSVSANPTTSTTGAASHANSANPIDMNEHILNKLTTMSDILVSRDGRVRKTETALADRTTDLAVLPSPAKSTSTAASNVSNVAALNPLSSQSAAIPTTEYLKNRLTPSLWNYRVLKAWVLY